MKIKIIILSWLLLAPSISFSQEIFSINGIIGYNLYHSDNSLPITRDEDFTNTFGLAVGYKFDLSEEFGLKIEGGYLSTIVKNVISETYTVEFGTPLEINIDIIQYSFPIDITVTRKLFTLFEYGLGVSVEGINREVKLNKNYEPNLFEDKLNMLSIGGNAIFGLSYQIPSIEKFSIVANIKLRYLFSVWENDKGRDLNNYNHKFFQGNISVGLGYKL
ncbi:MAG: outer membrane beta-barrel protein [Ignavibacteria bacterium]|nr:outer membrane beta-barrel protein [Ignavibacteria bacterium]